MPLASTTDLPTQRRSPLPFTGPWLLAPMEGVTDVAFRGLVLARHSPADLGGVYTEFVRVTQHALPVRVMRSHLGALDHEIPVGLQLMGSDFELLGRAACTAVEAGAPIIDLNFGCPSRRALKGCAGASLLKDPALLERTVRACRDALGESTPLSAKIRAGYADATQVEVLARAAEAGGAQMLTVHCRTFAEGYCKELDWSRIARAVAAVDIPVCGNGGVNVHADLERMRRETGCAYVMVGHGALFDPWIFSGHQATRQEAARFLWDYHQAMNDDQRAVGRIKQLLKGWTAGDLVEPAEERLRWMRERDPAAFVEWLQRESGISE